MDFKESVDGFVKRVSRMDVAKVANEEATKNALVLPFLQLLGFDVFDPDEVQPEFTADWGMKKGEKVDYAVFVDGAPAFLIECKSLGNELDVGKCSQLGRYFSQTEARIGILTDGVEYRFHSDIDKKGFMDQRPFMVVNFLHIDESLIPELRKLQKDNFSLDKALGAARDLRYTREVKKIFASELDDPSDEIVRFFYSKVCASRFTANAKEMFTPVVKKALSEFMSEYFKSRIESLVDGEKDESDDSETVEEVSQNGIVTTQDEWDGYYIIKAILRKELDLSRVFMRDTKSYCGVLLDDNNRKPLCRMHFNGPNLYLGLFDNPDKVEDRVPLSAMDDIYQYADRIRAVLAYYE